MGKRTGQRVRAKAKDLSSGPDRSTKIRGGGVAGQGTTAPRPKLVGITDGTSNTIMFGEVVAPAGPRTLSGPGGAGSSARRRCRTTGTRSDGARR